MSRESKMKQLIIIGRDDERHRLFRLTCRDYGLHLYQVLEPKNTIDWSQVEKADIIIADLEELNYGFEHCELLDTVRKLYPEKIVVGETDNFEPATSKIIQEMGANGYIYRNQLEETSVAAIVKMLAGERVFLGLPAHKQN